MLSDDSRTRIKEIVIKAYENDEEVNRQVREEVMDWWDKAGGYHLFRMGEIMKSQQKASKQKIKALKYHSCHFMVLWYEKALPRKKIHCFGRLMGNFAFSSLSRNDMG